MTGYIQREAEEKEDEYYEETAMKQAYVYKHRTGWWAVDDRATGKQIGGFFDTELEAYKFANSEGYIVN